MRIVLLPMDHNVFSRRRADSLIELLVVIGILAVLLGLLLPVMRNAREAAASVKCQSNLRQLTAAMHVYVITNDGRLPPAYWGDRDWDFPHDTASTGSGWLWWGRTDFEVQQCPTFAGRSWGRSDPFTGYNYNTSFLGRGEFEFIRPPTKLAAIRRPSGVVAFGDAGGPSVALSNKFMRAPPAASNHPRGDRVSVNTRAAGAQAFRHRKQTNAAFVDGHVEAIRERFDPTNLLPDSVGFLSDDTSAYWAD